jgi:hypothetical protein
MDVTLHKLPCQEVMLGFEDAKGVPHAETDFKFARVPTDFLAREPRALAALRANPFDPVWAPRASADITTPGCRVIGTALLRRTAGVFFIAAPRSPMATPDGRFMMGVSPDVMAR